MFSKLKLSLSRINYKLFFALLILGLAPAVYTTLRVFFLGQLPVEWSFSIAGQLSWVTIVRSTTRGVAMSKPLVSVGKGASF